MKIEKSIQPTHNQNSTTNYFQRLSRWGCHLVKQVPLLGTAYTLLDQFRLRTANAQTFSEMPIVWNQTIPVIPGGNSSLAQNLTLQGVLANFKGDPSSLASCVQQVSGTLMSYAQTFGACVNNSVQIFVPGFTQFLTFTSGNSDGPQLGVIVLQENDTLPYGYEECRKEMLNANITQTLTTQWNDCAGGSSLAFWLIFSGSSLAILGLARVLYKHNSASIPPETKNTPEELSLLLEASEGDVEEIEDTLQRKQKKEDPEEDYIDIEDFEKKQ